MVTQAPARSRVLIAVAFVLSCLGLMIFTWTQFGGQIPFAPEGYRIHAVFRETGLLVPNADVRIAGVNVGKVTSVEARGVNSLVTLDLKQRYAPVPTDTRAILRIKTLLGEAYVELSTGNGSGPKLGDGGTIPSSQVADTQALDQVLNSFGPDTQRKLQALLSGSFTAIAGRGEDLNNAIGNLDPLATDLSSVVGLLDQQRADVKSLVRNAASVLSTIGSRSADLQTVVTTGDQFLSATASRSRQLTATVDALPAFLGELRATMQSLRGTIALARPALGAIEPGAPQLKVALASLIALTGPALNLLRQGPALIRDAEAGLPSITRFTTAFKPAVDAVLPAARQVAPMISFLSQYSKELTSAMANMGSMLQATAGAATTTYTAGTPAGQAHYGRVLPILNNEDAWGQSVREPTNRHNAYYAPGEQNGLASGLSASDCDNLKNPSQVPLSAGNVPCKVQAAVNWGNGIAPGYYPHLTQAPLPTSK